MRRLAVCMLCMFVLTMFAAGAYAASVTFEVDDGGQATAKVRLYLANIPRDFDLTKPPAYEGLGRRFTVSNLTELQTYKFAALLVDTIDGKEVKSELSNIIQQKMPAAPVTPAPAAPTVAVDVSGTTATLTFAGIPTGTVPTNYLVKMIADPGLPSMTNGTLYESPTNPVTATGLTPGKKYNFYVRYAVDTLMSASTATASFTVPVAVPAAPKVTATSNGTDTVFTFDTGTVVPTRYMVRLAEDPVVPTGDAAGVLYEGTANPVTVKDLKQGVKYNFYGQYNVDTAVSAKSVAGSVMIPTVIQLKAPAIVIIEVTQ